MLHTLINLRANHRVRHTALVLSLAALGGCGGDAVKDAVDSLTGDGGFTTTTTGTTGDAGATTGVDANASGLTGLTGLTTGDASLTTGDVSSTSGDASATTGDASTTGTTGDAGSTTSTTDAGVVDAGPEPDGGIEGELGQLFGDGGLFGGPAPEPDAGFTPPPTSTGWTLNPDSSDNCPAEPPPTPIDPCLGIYWACGWEHADGRTYSCVCDWIHYLCI